MTENTSNDWMSVYIIVNFNKHSFNVTVLHFLHDIAEKNTLLVLAGYIYFALE